MYITPQHGATEAVSPEALTAEQQTGRLMRGAVVIGLTYAAHFLLASQNLVPRTQLASTCKKLPFLQGCAPWLQRETLLAGTSASVASSGLSWGFEKLARNCLVQDDAHGSHGKPCWLVCQLVSQALDCLGALGLLQREGVDDCKALPRLNACRLQGSNRR